MAGAGGGAGGGGHSAGLLTIPRPMAHTLTAQSAVASSNLASRAKRDAISSKDDTVLRHFLAREMSFTRPWEATKTSEGVSRG